MTAGSVDDAWYHGMESTFGGLQVVPVATSAARATGAYAATDLGGVGIFGISGTPQQLVRSARTLRRSPTESLKVCAVRRGRCLIEQSGREVMVTPGEFGLYDTGLPYRLTWQGTWECDVMTASPTALGVPARALHDARARTWSTATGAGAMLVQFMTACASMSGPTTVAQKHLATAGASLLAGTILNDFEPVADDAEELLRNQVESYIDRCLHRPELGPVSIAAAHHVSVRTIQRLFSGAGPGVCQRVDPSATPRGGAPGPGRRSFRASHHRRGSGPVVPSRRAMARQGLQGTVRHLPLPVPQIHSRGLAERRGTDRSVGPLRRRTATRSRVAIPCPPPLQQQVKHEVPRMPDVGESWCRGIGGRLDPRTPALRRHPLCWRSSCSHLGIGQRYCGRGRR